MICTGGPDLGLPVAERWFEFKTIDNGITQIWEPHVDPLIRCNIWHIRGRTQDAVIDTGLGVASLKNAARHLFESDLIAVATHTHFDHTGGIHEFETRLVHENEASSMSTAEDSMILKISEFEEGDVQAIERQGYSFSTDLLLTAIPHENFDLTSHRLEPATPTSTIKDGDKLDLGNRVLEILHLPGHSPGSIGLWEAETGTLFSGDAIYNGPLLYDIPGANRDHYISTLERLMDLPVTIVHAGHDPSFGRDTLREIVRSYLKKWRA